MPTFQDGTVNIYGITNPGLYVDIVPQTPIINGFPSNVEGLVGVGSWGPIGAALSFTGVNDCPYGSAQIRPYDLPTHVLVAVSQGQNVAFKGVRVSDGTDTAASVSLPNSLGTLTALYTGSLGNQIGIAFQAGTNAGAYTAVVSMPGQAPQTFQNIVGALASATVSGTNFTSVPVIQLSAPQITGGIQATARATLVTTGTPTLTAPGTGFAVNDTVTFANGLVVKVTAVTGGVPSTISVLTPGTLTSGSVPTNPLAQSSTSGAGTGMTLTLTWAIGPVQIVEPGFGYTSMNATLVGGGGTGQSITITTSFAAALARAINEGSPQNSPSSTVMFTAGTGTGAPTLGVITYMAGGTDGAAGVGTAQMLGTDTLPRKGMYALRSSGCDCFALCDLSDSTSFATQLSFGLQETMLPVTTGPFGDTIANAVALRQTTGIDSYGLWWLVGDWPQFYDTTNGILRYVSPQAFALGLAGNLSPEQSPINKQLIGVEATETSNLGIITASAQNAQAQNGGVDFIGRTTDLGENYFSFCTGNNASSLVPSNRVEYTRLTYWLARQLQSFAAKSIVGQMQSIQANDPTRTKAKMIIDSFLQLLCDPDFGSNGYGMIDTFATVCDLTNNPPSSQALGFLFLYAQVRYLNAVRYFIIKLQGGGNVTVTSQENAPTQSQLSQIIAAATTAS
jgi:hypothetical protein